MIQKIGIVGGTGVMGQMFEQAWQEAGLQVRVTGSKDLGQEKSMVMESDLVIVSVPIDHSAEVVRRIGPWLKSHQLLSDFTSVKAEVIPAMKKTEAQVVSCHPMFGQVNNLEGHNVIMMPLDGGGKLFPQYQRLYRELGLNVVVMQAWEKHDESMSVIQGLTHFIHLVFSQTLAKRQVDLQAILQICSPVYQANFAFASRILSRDPHLYTRILMDNQENLSLLADFLSEAHDSWKLIEQKDEQAFEANFRKTREFLGDLAPLFSAQSDYLVEKLKEYQP